MPTKAELQVKYDKAYMEWYKVIDEKNNAVNERERMSGELFRQKQINIRQERIIIDSRDQINTLINILGVIHANKSISNSSST